MLWFGLYWCVVYFRSPMMPWKCLSRLWYKGSILAVNMEHHNFNIIIIFRPLYDGMEFKVGPLSLEGELIGSGSPGL